MVIPMLTRTCQPSGWSYSWLGSDPRRPVASERSTRSLDEGGGEEVVRVVDVLNSELDAVVRDPAVHGQLVALVAPVAHGGRSVLLHRKLRQPHQT